MQCIRNGIPRLGLLPDEDVGRALKSCVGGTGLEAVTMLLHLGSQIEHVTSAEQEIPFSGGDMMDVVSAVGGAVEDFMELCDKCPLPSQKGGAVSLAVETAVEVMNLARDSLEQACLEAVQSEEPLVDLAGQTPLQALLLAARVRYTTAVETALEAGTSLEAVVDAWRASRAAALALVAGEPAGRRRAALGALQALLLEEEFVVQSLAVAAEPTQAAALWEGQVRFYFAKVENSFHARCLGREFPVGFEYGPRRPFPASTLTQRFRREFMEVFNIRGGPWKALLMRGPPSAGAVDMCRDMCESLGLIPAVLDGATLASGDTFWRRATAAAKSTSGGVVAVIIVAEAHKAKKAALDACIDACKQKQVALCLTYDPAAPMDFSIPGCAGSRCAVFEAAPEVAEPGAAAAMASALLGAGGFVEADSMAAKLVPLLEALAAASGQPPAHGLGVLTLKSVCEEAGKQLASGGSGPLSSLASAVRSCLPAAGQGPAPEEAERLIAEHLRVDSP